jgi:transcription elongation GreA/GreB family factor
MDASPSRPPLARALIGREKGDTVSLRTVKGTREYQIVDVQFLPVGGA